MEDLAGACPVLADGGLADRARKGEIDVPRMRRCRPARFLADIFRSFFCRSGR